MSRFTMLILLLTFSLSHASPDNSSQESNPLISEDTAKIDILTRLHEIREAIKEKKLDLKETQKQLTKTKTPEDEAELKAQQEMLVKAIAKLNQSFEHVATDGADMTPFSEIKVEEFDWQKELILIAKPIMDSLKELTERPRKIEQLRGEIARLELTYEMTQKTHKTLVTLTKNNEISELVREKLNLLTETWAKRMEDSKESLEMTRYQLNQLNMTKSSSLDAITSALHQFVQGRGITISLVFLVVIAIFGGMQLIQRILFFFYRRGSSHRNYLRHQRMLQYGVGLLTVIFSIFGVITVLYARNDVLLLGLTILGLFMILFSLRTILPKYIAEIRILLNVGPVRQDERLIYHGIPFHVRTIGMYSTLLNPELEGVIRLPTATLNSLVSRPRTEEPWFPCQVGDYLLLEDDSFAVVLQQTVENVRLKLRGSTALIPTEEFLNRSIRNLSRDGFFVAVTFGVDYQHQTECLTRIPKAFQHALEQALQQSELADMRKSLLVEFKEANASSLDYLIVITMSGEAASSYYSIGRLIQKTCVEVCNKEQWVIPFAQLTVHAGEAGVLPT